MLCHVTQMGLLRLLTLRTVMREDVITRAGAWRFLDLLRRDEPVGWFLFTLWKVPETKERSLEQIERTFRATAVKAA